MGKKHRKHTNIPRAISAPNRQATKIETEQTRSSEAATKPALPIMSVAQFLGEAPRPQSGTQPATAQPSRLASQSPSWSVGTPLPEHLPPPHTCYQHAIEGILPQGLCLMAGKAGSGLSRLALDLGISVASGQPLLDSIPSMQGSVLFISETGRVTTLMQSYSIDHQLPENLTVLEMEDLETDYLSWKTQTMLDAIEEAINEWLIEHPDARLVIIDNLDAICNNRFAGLNTYALARRLHYMGHSGLSCGAEFSLLLLHHTRRPGTADALDAFSRLSSSTDYATSFLLLYQRTSTYGYKTAHLRVVDPSLTEQIIPICFDPREGHWRLSMSETDDAPLSPERDAILSALHDATRPLSPTELATLLNKENEAIRTLLHSMSQDGQVFSPARGLYIPIHPRSTTSHQENVSPPNNIGEQPAETTKTVSPQNTIADVSDDTVISLPFTEDMSPLDNIDFFSISIQQDNTTDFLTLAQNCPIS